MNNEMMLNIEILPEWLIYDSHGSNEYMKAPRPEFESESLARQARMIGHYTTRANALFCKRDK